MLAEYLLWAGTVGGPKDDKDSLCPQDAREHSLQQDLHGQAAVLGSFWDLLRVNDQLLSSAYFPVKIQSAFVLVKLRAASVLLRIPKFQEGVLKIQHF